jgi:hypothetical protein
LPYRDIILFTRYFEWEIPKPLKSINLKAPFYNTHRTNKTKRPLVLNYLKAKHLNGKLNTNGNSKTGFKSISL